jgi:hypothetical protein
VHPLNSAFGECDVLGISSCDGDQVGFPESPLTLTPPSTIIFVHEKASMVSAEIQKT